MKLQRVEFLLQAAREVEEALEWYNERRTPARSEFLEEVEHAARLAAQRPQAWPAFEAGTRRNVLQRYPFSVIFRVAARAIQVDAVAHHKRKPRYWRYRRSSNRR